MRLLETGLEFFLMDFPCSGHHPLLLHAPAGPLLWVGAPMGQDAPPRVTETEGSPCSGKEGLEVGGVGGERVVRLQVAAWGWQTDRQRDGLSWDRPLTLWSKWRTSVQACPGCWA